MPIFFNENYMIRYIKLKKGETEFDAVTHEIEDIERKLNSLRQYRRMLLLDADGVE